MDIKITIRTVETEAISGVFNEFSSVEEAKEGFNKLLNQTEQFIDVSKTLIVNKNHIITVEFQKI